MSPLTSRRVTSSHIASTQLKSRLLVGYKYEHHIARSDVILQAIDVLQVVNLRLAHKQTRVCVCVRALERARSPSQRARRVRRVCWWRWPPPPRTSRKHPQLGTSERSSLLIVPTWSWAYAHLHSPAGEGGDLVRRSFIIVHLSPEGGGAYARRHSHESHTGAVYRLRAGRGGLDGLAPSSVHV